MENHPHESIDTVFGCVIPYIHDGDDRNAVSLVCRNWYELDGMTRKHLTVHLLYSPAPSRVHQRFPSIESLTLQGFPGTVSMSPDMDIHMLSTWIQEISVSYKCLKALHVRLVSVHDSDLELLARTRSKDLRLLKIISCCGFSTDGLMHIGKYFTELKSLSLARSELDDRDGKWLHELAMHNISIESLDLGYAKNIDVNDLTLLAKNCSQSLVSFKLIHGKSLDLVDFFRYAVRLEDVYVSKYVNVGIKFPPNLRGMRMSVLNKSSYQLVPPFAHQLRELQIGSITLDVDSQCFLIQRCPNLEVLYLPYFSCDNVDEVLQAIGQFCKKLRKLSSWLYSWMGLIAVAQGCIDLECLNIGVNNIKDITSENFECIGTYLKNLRDFSISAFHNKTTIPLDDGIRLMLIGCSKLERLEINLRGGALTDVGLGYIGKYGHSLKYLSLPYQEENGLGLAELSKGCPKLRELKLTDYPYHPVNDKVCSMFDIHSLRYVWGRDQHFIDFALTRHSLEDKDLINDS